MTITTDASAPLIAVVGSTGLQGGSVINALAASDKPYRIRGITRDPSKPKATSLSDRGVEVVKCNLTVDNGPEIEKAFQGATYVFVRHPLSFTSSLPSAHMFCPVTIFLPKLC